MHPWNDKPFLRLLPPFIGGILFAIYGQTHFSYYLLAGIFLLLFFFSILSHWNSFQLKYKWRWLNGTLIYLLLFMTGIQLTELHTITNQDTHFKNYLQDAEKAIIKINESPIQKSATYKTTAEVIGLYDSTNFYATQGKVLCYFRKGQKAKQLQYGDILITQPVLETVDPPKNPNQFNYKQYLSFHNIHHQAFLDKNSWNITNQNKGTLLFRYAYQLRAYFLSVLKKYIRGEQELAIAAAITLGYKDNLSDHIQKAYANSGAMHVLAVSGLHVGFIYLIFNYLFHFLTKIKHGRYLKPFLLIVLIWAFAVLTGLRPSVLRASTMFSFIIIGQAFRQHTNIYNTLAFSAFFLLLFDPYLIMEVGFQLSYLAVVGIVFLQPRIYDLITIQNYILDKVWTITAVSIAAQIATFPLGLLYFHQFPTMFMVSNLVVIPAATIILYSGIGLLTFNFIPPMANVLGQLLSYVIGSLNKVIFGIQQLPGSLIKGITITIAETWMIYFTIITLIVFILYRRAWQLRLVLVFMIGLAGYNLYEKYQAMHQRQLVVYHVPKHSVYDLIQGQQSHFFADSTLLKNQSKLLFHVKHNWWAKRIQKVNKISSRKMATANIPKTPYLIKQKKYMQVFGHRIAFVEKSLPKYPPPQPLKVDYLIIKDNPYLRLKHLLHFYEPNQIIIDSSNKPWLAEKWQKSCQKLDVPCHNVIKTGAFQTHL